MSNAPERISLDTKDYEWHETDSDCDEGGCVKYTRSDLVPDITTEGALTVLARQIAELREALTRLRDCDWVITLPDRMDAVREIARNALEAKHD